MNTEIPVEPEVSYPPQPEIDLEPGSAGSAFDSPGDFAGAPSSTDYVEGGTVPPSRRFRGRDKRVALRARNKNEDSTLLRHTTHCSICNHPEHEAIDQSILHWYSPTVIAHEFDLADRRIVYRHAHALGLFHRRMEQSRHALGFLIEQAQSIVPTADAIIRAVRALACIDDHGHWREPRKEVVITHRYEDATTQLAEHEDADPMSRFERANNRIGVPSGASRARDLQSGSALAPSSGHARRGTRQRERGRPLGGRSFSSDKKSVRSSGVSTPEASEPAETRHKRWSPLRLFSTHLLRKDRRNSNNINKTAKTSRHAFQ